MPGIKQPLSTYIAELHIHTVLSPCASIEMIPPLIIRRAQERKINLIAITDHNAIANVPAVIEAAEGTQISVLSGIELQTREEIHSLCLFDDYPALQEFFGEIIHTFPTIKNNPEFFGEQFVVDKTGDFIRKEERLLIASSSVSLNDAFHLVEKYDGICIPAHVNRTAFGLLPTLGMPPTDIDIRIMEISKHLSITEAKEKFPLLKNHALLQNGDAHFLNEIIGFNTFQIAAPTIKEIQKAIFHKDNRSFKNNFYSVSNELS